MQRQDDQPTRNMLEVDAARSIILAQCGAVPAQSVPLDAALGRVLAEDVRAPLALPPFDNSAMDGYALKAGEAGLAAGTELAVSGEQAAGDAAIAANGAAWEIMTGARMPEGFDTVLPVEQATVLQRDAQGRALRIRLDADVHVDTHVRRAGEDIAAGELAAAAGSVLGSHALTLLRGVGIAQLPVVRRPKLAILNTGRELVDDARPLASGEIHNTNGPFLHAQAQQAGAEVVLRETVSDDAALFTAALARAEQAGAELIVTTGAVSMGRYDFIPDVLAAQGAKVFFHKLKMRPGKPLLFARLQSGVLLFGLPGNPVSSAVGWRFFVEPALRRMLGMVDEQPWRLPLAADVRKKPGMTFFHKARVACDGDGQVRVRSLPGQESFRIRPLAAANAWLQLLPEAEALSAGTLVEVWPLSHFNPQAVMGTIE